MDKLLIFILALFISSTAIAQKERITVKLVGDTTIITNIGAWENCAARFLINLKVDGFNITMTERDTIKRKATCYCMFDITSSIVNLPAGTYTVEVYREWLKKFGYFQDTTIYIGSTTFSISQIGSAARLTNTYQSECYQLSNIDQTHIFSNNQITISCYPNPIILPDANPSITIQYHLAQEGQTLINIFDASGKKLFTVMDEPKEADNHELRLHTSLFRSSGIYYCTLTTVKHPSEMNEARIVKLVVMKR